jgi:hypothetical protein
MRAWAIKHWDKGLYIDTVSRTRAEAIRKFKLGYVGAMDSWKDDSKYGVHRAVRVAVEIEQKPRGARKR